jgi:uncharacterized protein YceK
MRMIGILAFTAIALSGCGTVMTKTVGSQWGDKYSGTTCSAHGTREAARKRRFITPLFALDTLISAVADTVVLPIDLIYGEPKYKGCRGFFE